MIGLKGYVRGIGLSMNLVLIPAALAALLAMGLSEATAADRYGSIQLAYQSSYSLDELPGDRKLDHIYSIDLGYFFSEDWATFFALDLEMGGQSVAGVATGARFYPFLATRTQPYFDARFLYLINSSNAIGWRFHFGVEWDLIVWTGVDNMRFSIDAGVSQLFSNENQDRQLVIDLARVGLAWQF